MRAIQKILVPFDGSPLSDEAASYAADIARRYDAELTLLYVDHPVTYALAGESSTRDLERRQTAEPKHAQLDRQVARAGPAPREPVVDTPVTFEHAVIAARRAALAAGVTRVETIRQRGNPVAEILRCANDDECDLIVMGTHGRSGLTRVLHGGSVAEEIVRAARCPVLTIRVTDAT